MHVESTKKSPGAFSGGRFSGLAIGPPGDDLASGRGDGYFFGSSYAKSYNPTPTYRYQSTTSDGNIAYSQTLANLGIGGGTADPQIYAVAEAPAAPPPANLPGSGSEGSGSGCSMRQPHDQRRHHHLGDGPEQAQQQDGTKPRREPETAPAAEA